MILSVGSYGCNLRCPFCQNFEISWSDRAMALADQADYISPEKLAEIAAYYRDRGNIGVAFTYNEPLIGYEFVRDTARLVHEAGMVNVLVSNGTAELSVWEELAPYIDAVNIDLKGFTDKYYSQLLKGDRFPMWDWVGGRTSVMSAVGLLPLALKGVDVDGFLAGAAACDALGRNEEVLDNPAMLLALSWYKCSGGQGGTTQVVLPYKDSLMLFA